MSNDPQVGRHVEELEDVRLVVLDGQLILQFVGMMRRFDAAGEPVPLRLEGRQWLARLDRVRPPQVRALVACGQSVAGAEVAALLGLLKEP